MNKKIPILLILEFLISLISIILMVRWLEWRLVLTLFLFIWANNLMLMREIKERRKKRDGGINEHRHRNNI